MPKWVFYDCAVMPGAVFGLGRPAKEVDFWVRAALEVPEDYEGIVPLSVFIAIPMLEPGAWNLYTLCDINNIAPGAGPAGLSLLTIGLGIKVFRMRRLLGTTQWRAPKLDRVAGLGPLDVVTAYTPAHSFVRTLTFSTEIDDDRLQGLLLGQRVHPASPVATHLLDVDDDEMLRALQADVEAGQRWKIVGPSRQIGSHIQVPLRRETAEGRVAWL
jgi:hypothetical protein